MLGAAREIIKRKLVNHGIPDPIIDDVVRYIDVLSKEVDISGVVLFGSIVYGRPRIGSDIDILVVSPNFDCEYNKKILLARKIARFRPARISAVWLGEKEIMYNLAGFEGWILDALYFGLILYDRKGLLRKLRKKIEECVKKGIIERKLGMWKLNSENLNTVFT